MPRRLAHGSHFSAPALLLLLPGRPPDRQPHAGRTPAAPPDIFQLLQDNGLQINPAKCVFAVAEIDFLGHRVSTAGISPLPKHVEALQCLPVPTDVKGLQRFLGLINFYRRFLPGIAATLLPLTNALGCLPWI
jgi:hypothetical protein